MINNLLLTSAQPSVAADYIEDYFSTALYTGNGSSQYVYSGVPTSDTASWTTTTLNEGSNGGACYTNTDSSGNIYYTGYADDGTIYAIVAKYNSSGVLQWQRKLKQGTTQGRGVVSDSSGNVYVVGTATDVSTYCFVAKYNSSGTIQWQRKLLQNATEGYGVSVDASGNVYVVGYATDGNSVAFLAKYNSSGTIQWQRRVREQQSVCLAVAVDASGNIFITGSDTFVGGRYAFITKYNSSGTLQWQRKLTGGFPYGYGVAIDSSGNVYVAGSAGNGAPEYAFIAKYNTSGTIQWQRSLQQGNTTRIYGITIDSSDNVYVAGKGNEQYAFAAKYNSSGTIQWQRKLYQSPSSSATSWGVSVDTLGNLYVSGTGYTGSVFYPFFSKLKTDGTTTSGTAIINMDVGTLTDAAGTLTDAAAGATSASGTLTESAGTATESAGTATSSSATQPAVSGAGGLVWMKGRSGATDHALYDTARGATFDIASNLTTGQTTQTTGLTSFGATGFSISSLAKLNTNNAIYAAWTFREKAKFFDIVTYTGNGANRTITHNLGSAPGMMIIKSTSSTTNWIVYHRSLTDATRLLVLNNSTAEQTLATVWNSTAPTATEFSLGTNGSVNGTGTTYVAYLFAHDAGGFGLTGSDNVISCGSYTGNGSTTGPTINLGWEPQFVLIKMSSSTGNWNMFDNMRGITTGGNDPYLFSNTTAAESVTNGNLLSITSTGFSITSTNAEVNTNTGTYIYMAIRRGPMKVPTDATTVFQPTVYTGTNVNNRLVNTTIAPDMAWIRQRNSTAISGMVVGDRLRGQPYLVTGSNAAEVTSATALDQQIVSATEYGTAFSSMNGVWVGTDAAAQLNVSTTASNQVIEAFKRAPGFFDAVAYTGTGVARTISHNLNAVPELMIVKTRTANNWFVYSASGGIDNYLLLNGDSGFNTGGGSTLWNNTAPTSSVFSLGTSGGVNGNGVNTIAYLFATCPGVSKVGSYTGTGTTQQINCGFTSGARLVLIKRTDSAGGWYFYDSARGIVAGNDPYILLHLPTAEVTSTDYVDAYSAGFELSSTAPAGLNQAPVTTWTSRTSGFGSSPIYCLTYGNGLFVAGGDAGKLFTSTDGITWTSRTSGFGANAIYGVTYGNGIFVAVGGNGTLTTSTDGITWTSRTSGFGSTLISEVTYGNGLFVAVGYSGTLTTSSDGITWTTQTSGFGTTIINDITYGDGLYVAVGYSGKLCTSPDGVTWTARTSGFGTTAIAGVTYGNGLYVAAGFSGVLTTSTDGITWTPRTSGFGTTDIRDVTYGNGLFVAVGDNGTLTTSTDGITWTSRTSGFGTTVIFSAAYGNNLYVAAGNNGILTTSSIPNYMYLAIA